MRLPFSDDLSPTPKRTDIFRRQLKSFAFAASVAKSLVPIRFDADWIVRFNTVDRLGWYRNLDRKLAFAAPDRDRVADLVVAP